MTKKKTKKKKKGFTLIELLIVIAIIGILASVVLVSLSSAREKAKAANFKSQVSSLQSKAVIACDGSASGLMNADDLGGSQNGYSIDSVNGSCGMDGDGTFSINISSTLLTNSCTVTVTESGVGAFNGC